MKIAVKNIKDYNAYEFPQEEWVKSCVAPIDTILGGYCKGELTVIGAPSSNGKSLVTLTSALNMAAQGSKILYISLENSLSTDHARHQRIVEKYNLKEDGMEFDYFNADWADANEGMATLNDIAEAAYAKKYDAIFIDSIDFLAGAIGKDAYSSFTALNLLSAGLRQIASKSGAAVITTAQLNRGSMSKNIQDMNMSDMQGSIGICQKAHAVWVISKNDGWAIKVVKNRSEKKTFEDYFSMGDIDGRSFDIRKAGPNKNPNVKYRK